MLSPGFERELRRHWFPHMPDAALARLTDLLNRGSPLLISGRFTAALPQGCLATHIAWHHPITQHRTLEAGIDWLTRIAGLNPATSVVLLDWDRLGPCDWGFRSKLLDLLHTEHDRRQLRAEHRSRQVGV